MYRIILYIIFYQIGDFVGEFHTFTSAVFKLVSNTKDYGVFYLIFKFPRH